MFLSLSLSGSSAHRAPRLMQAISNDNLIGFLRFFKRTGLNGEPSYALLLTVVLSELGVLIASLDLVAPILTMYVGTVYMYLCTCTVKSLKWWPQFSY